MPGPSPLNSACRCCSGPPNVSVTLQYASVEQACSATSCGDTPCTSTDPDDGNCVTVAQVCSPNWADLTQAEKCVAKRYLTITTVDRSGGNNHGRTSVKQYTTDAEGACDSETTCSGSVTTVEESELIPGSPGPGGGGCTGTYTESYATTTTTVRTWAEDCSDSSETTCEGSSSISSSGTCTAGGFVFLTTSYECESTYGPDCEWSGTTTSTINGDTTGPDAITTDCGGYLGTIENEDPVITPEPECKITVTYTAENTQGNCSPNAFPSFPSFIDCTPEGEEPPELPELTEGQAYSEEAYKYQNPNNPQIKSEARVKYRVEHNPSGSCYLKVWFRKKIQSWKYEDCETGFAGDSPRTSPWSVDCSPEGNPCTSRWSTDGAPTYEDDGTYEWSGNGYPCYNDDDKVPSACENFVFNMTPKELTAGENQSVAIEYKWSQVEDYEPNWPDENSSQGCKPNNFPIPDPEDCPEYNS